MSVDVPIPPSPETPDQVSPGLSSSTQFQAASRYKAAKLVAALGPGHWRVKFMESGKPCTAVFTVPLDIGNLRVRQLFLRKHQQISRAEVKIRRGITPTSAELAAFYIAEWPGFQTRFSSEILRQLFLVLLEVRQNLKTILDFIRVRIPSSCYLPLVQRPSIRSCAE
jgi:hypothetical protein